MIELGIYISAGAGYEVAKMAARYLEIARESSANPSSVQLQFSANAYPNGIPNRALIIGGNETIRDCLQQWANSEAPPFVGIKPMGTNNVLFQALYNECIAMTADDFIGYDLSELTYFPKFRVGIAGDRTFGNTASFSQYDGTVAKVNSIVRAIPLVPGKLRLGASYFGGLVESLFKANEGLPLMEMFLTTPFFGFVPIAPWQDPFGEELTRVSIKEGSKWERIAKLFRTLAAFSLGRAPSPGVLNFETAKEFSARNANSHLFLDGDLIREDREEIQVRRSEKPLRLVALV